MGKDLDKGLDKDLEISPLFVDSAAGSREYAPLLADYFLRAKLPVTKIIMEQTASTRFYHGGGDFVFGGNGPDGPVMIGVELKKLPDFVSSTIDTGEGGRLDTFQLPNMEPYQYKYLIIEGAFMPCVQPRNAPDVLGHLSARDIYMGAFPTASAYQKAPLPMGMRNGTARALVFQRMIGKLHSILIGHGVTFLWSFDDRATAATVFQIWSFWQKPWQEHEFNFQGRRFKGGKSKAQNLTKKEVYTYLVTCVDGIGGMKANLVAQAVPTIEDLVKLDIGGLRKLGLDEKQATRIWCSLRGRNHKR